MNNSTKSTRNWCFTLHNYDENDIAHLKNMMCDKITHLIYQEEICPTTNRKHIQGHICFKNVKTMSGVKRMLGRKDAHLEPMRGTPKQSAEYCSKSETAIEGSGYEAGVIPQGQGTRTDIRELIDKIYTKQIKYEDIVNEYPTLFLQYRNGLAEVCDKIYGTKRDFKTNVTVLYGASGTGKSRDAFNTEDYYVLRSAKTGVWFDGYNYNNTVIIDDFYGWIPFNQLLNLLDRYAMKIDVKGGAKEFNSPNIIITSNKSPLDWYPNLSTEHKIALLRRIDKCIYYNRQGTIDVTKGLEEKLNKLSNESALENNDELACLTLSLKISQLTEVAHGNTILEPPLNSDIVSSETNEEASCINIYDNGDESSLASISGRDKYGNVVNNVTCRNYVDENGNITYYDRCTNEAVWFWCKKYNKGAPIYHNSEILTYDWDSDTEEVCLS